MRRGAQQRVYCAGDEPSGRESVRAKLLDALAGGQARGARYLHTTCGIACGLSRLQLECALLELVALELVQRQGSLWKRCPEVVPVYDQVTRTLLWQIEGVPELAQQDFGDKGSAQEALRIHNHIALIAPKESGALEHDLVA